MYKFLRLEPTQTSIYALLCVHILSSRVVSSIRYIIVRLEAIVLNHPSDTFYGVCGALELGVSFLIKNNAKTTIAHALLVPVKQTNA